MQFTPLFKLIINMITKSMHSNIKLVIVQKVCYFWGMQGVIDYISASFGLRAVARPLDKLQLSKLPLYIKHGFELSGGEIEGKQVLWAKPLNNEELTPNWLLGQKEQLTKYFQRHVIFVFDRMDSWLRKRLIEKRLGFIQAGKQVFVPELLLELSDLRSHQPAVSDTSEHPGFPTQAAILHHLQRERLDGLSFQQIALKLDYSTMTITRVARELEQFKLAKLGRGKEKSIRFERSGKELWNEALSLLRTPVKENWYAYGPGVPGRLLEAGDTALASYSQLAEGRVKQFAFGKEQFRSLKKLGQLPELNAHQGNIRIEIWQYDPRIITGPAGLTVDRLSLYLSMRKNTDVRVKDALEEMINSIEW
jgi:hypothetical protein